MEPTKRIEWIDEYKGFVLLMVCLFHVEQIFKNVYMGMEYFSTLRMSAFFFISGVLFSTRRFSSFKDYFIHKSKVLLIPYVLLSLLFLVLDPVVWNFEFFSHAPKMTIMNTQPEINSRWDYIYWNLVKIFAVGKSSIGSGPLWFVFTLYSISLIFFAVQSLTSKIFSKSILQKITITFIAIASFCGGWLLYKNHLRLPLGIERDLTTLSFFAFGFLSKNFIKKLGNCNTVILSCITTIAFCLYFVTNENIPWFSIMNNTLGKNPLRFITASLLGIAGLVGAFQLISKLPSLKFIYIIKGILRNISRNALVILAVHWWILLILRLLFKQELDKPYIAYFSILIVAAGTILSIPLFRCKLYKLLGKEKVSLQESLSTK